MYSFSELLPNTQKSIRKPLLKKPAIKISYGCSENYPRLCPFTDVAVMIAIGDKVSTGSFLYVGFKIKFQSKNTFFVLVYSSKMFC